VLAHTQNLQWLYQVVYTMNRLWSGGGGNEVECGERLVAVKLVGSVGENEVSLHTTVHLYLTTLERDTCKVITCCL